MKRKNKPKPGKAKTLTGIRFDLSASNCVAGWAAMTDRSANWIASYIVNRFERVITGSLSTTAVKTELKRMASVVAARRKADGIVQAAQQELKLASTK